MKKCLACLLVALWTGPVNAQQPIRWGSDSEGGAPYIFKDPQDPNKNIGYEVELAQALARELGQAVEFKQYAFQSLVSGLDRGDFDFAMNGLEITPDRKKQVRFSRPYYIYRQQLVARDGESRFTSLDDIKRLKLRVGTMEETAAERLLTKADIEKRSYEGPVQAYDDLAVGRVDAVLMDLPMAIYYAKPRKDLRFVGEAIAPGYYAIAFAKDNAVLQARVDHAITHLIDDGTLQRIYEKWGLWNSDQSRLALASANDVTAEAEGQWRLSDYLPLLLAGARETMVISFASFGLAMIIGLAVAVTRLYTHATFSWLAVLYVEFFRGIPVLILLFFLYNGLPVIGQQLGMGEALKLSAFSAAVIGFGLNYAAYEAEIYRAGISSIPAGQWEAAVSLGLSPTQTFRRIILPQATRVILPPMTNDFVALFKDTSIVSIITIVELSKQYQILAKSSSRYLEIGLATAALYLLMSVPLGYLSRYLERRWSKQLEE